MLVFPNNLSRLSVTSLHSYPFPTKEQIFRRWLNTALKSLRLEWSKLLDGSLPLLNIIKGNVILEDIFLCIVLVKYQLLICLIYCFL